MVDRATVHPAFLQNALDAEAEAWFVRTAVAVWIARMATTGRSQAKLAEICKAVFVEGFYEGVLAIKNDKSLQESMGMTIVDGRAVSA